MEIRENVRCTKENKRFIFKRGVGGSGSDTLVC